MRNYYEILGISRDATPAQIKAAYRKLAKKYHPDSSSGSEEDRQRFQEIQEAYEVLSDPEQRKNYHYYGHEAYRKSYYARHGHDGHCGACEEGRAHMHPQEDEEPPASTIRIAVRLELSETLRTVRKKACYTERIPNPDAGSWPRYVEHEWVFEVEIPKGSYEHQYFMLEDVICQGEAFLEHLRELQMEKRYVIVVLLRDTPGFRRQGYHLYADQEVDYHTLVLGGSIRIPTLDGVQKVRISPGTDTSRTVRLESQGLVRPKRIGGRGDLHVTLHVRIPKELTPEQRNVFMLLKEVMEREKRE